MALAPQGSGALLYLARLARAFLFPGENMKGESDNGRLIVTPITRDEEKLVFAMAAAFAAFEAVVSPVTGEAVRCNEDDKKKMFSFDSSGRRM